MILPYAQIKCPAFYYIDGAAGDLLLLLVLLLFQSTEFYATCADRGYRGILLRHGGFERHPAGI